MHRHPLAKSVAAVRRQPFSKNSMSKTDEPIKATFHVKPPWEEGAKDYIN